MSNEYPERAECDFTTSYVWERKIYPDRDLLKRREDADRIKDILLSKLPTQYQRIVREHTERIIKKI